MTLMKAGKHVLCEKPMATTYIDCDGMVLQAHNSRVILLEAMRTLSLIHILLRNAAAHAAQLFIAVGFMQPFSVICHSVPSFRGQSPI